MDTNKERMAVMNLPKHIKKSHQLVFSRQDLTPREADVFALMIAHMKPEDWEQKVNEYRFSAAQLSAWFDVNKKHISTIFEPVADRLTKKNIGIKTYNEKKGEYEYEFYGIFTSIKYRDGFLILKPNADLKNEYIEYNQGFSLINTRNYLDLNTEYAKRLYEILSRFKTENFRSAKYKVNELKGLFGLLDTTGKIKSNRKSFSDISVFIRRCIKDSIKEISTNSLTKYEIEFLVDEKTKVKGYRTLKENRKIVGIEFLYKWNNQKKIIVNTLPQTQDVTEIKQAMSIIKELEIRRVQKKEKLTNQELNSLSEAYLKLGQQNEAEQIKKLIVEDEDNKSVDIEKFLEKIKKIKEVNS